MQKLVKGIHSFQHGFFASHRQLFEQLATAGQKPETLFITCSDSRVVPNLITNAAPGELFMVRNVGNVVPKAELPGGTAAAIEYAVEVLGVENVIVCGHTQCGAMQALLNPEQMENLPFVKRWLSQTGSVRTIIQEKYGHLSPEARLTAATQENVLASLENLRALPFVNDKLTQGKLLLSGWVFHIARGEVYDYDAEAGEFTLLGS
ncbi:MAG: carbonic anhydrase [Myxococcales bacterium]|nr:carbonic anhydrase [Myxococcales bacterium]MCB9578350.1 carbonic anhydrase [Polyangiaceae bacterium]